MIRTILFLVLLAHTWHQTAAKSNQCMNNPCKNKGLCTIVNATIPSTQCKCKSGWGGNLCEMGLNGNSEICTKKYTITDKDTCKSIMRAQRINARRFFRLNPNLDCNNNLEIGSSICLNNGGDGCSLFYDLKQNEKNCTILLDNLGLNMNTFKALNPHIDCSKEIGVKSVCIDGTSPDCLQEYTIAEGDTIETILKKRQLSNEDFHRANPFISEENITVGQVVCLVAKKRRSHIDKLHKVLDKLSESNQNLKQKYKKYRNDPKESNRYEVETEIKSLIKKPEFRKSLKKLEESDETFIYLSKERKLDRNQMCNDLKDKPIYKNSSNCFCGDTEPVTYCLHVFYDEMAPLVKEYHNEFKKNNYAENYNLTRVKRGLCSFSDAFDTLTTGEISYECCVIAGLEFCLNIHGGFDPKARGLEAELFNMHIGGTFTACIPFIKKLVTALKLNEKFGDLACLAEASINYYPFQSNLKLAATIGKILVLEVSGVYQMAHAPDWLCVTDYCQKPQCYVDRRTWYFKGLELTLDLFYWSFTLYSYGDQTPKCQPDGLADDVPLMRNKPLVSANGRYKAVLEDTGNFVLYDTSIVPNRAKFATGTLANSNPEANYLIIRKSGNMVLYAQNNKKWETGTVYGEENRPYKLVLQNEGKLVLFDSSMRAIWLTA